MKKILIVLLTLAGCANIEMSSTSLTRDVTSAELTKDNQSQHIRLIVQAKNGWVEADNNTLYIRFNANPVLSTQAEKTLKSMFIPCRYTGITKRSLTFACLPSVTIYPEVTKDSVDLVIVP